MLRRNVVAAGIAAAVSHLAAYACGQRAGACGNGHQAQPAAA